MDDITLSYKGITIATMSASGSKTIQTAGKYCEDDIALSYIKPPSAVAYHVRTVSATGESTAISVTKGIYNFENVGAVPFQATDPEQTIDFASGNADVDLDGNIRVQSTFNKALWHIISTPKAITIYSTAAKGTSLSTTIPILLAPPKNITTTRTANKTPIPTSLQDESR